MGNVRQIRHRPGADASLIRGIENRIKNAICEIEKKKTNRILYPGNKITKSKKLAQN
jgi:hypothetical protein